MTEPHLLIVDDARDIREPLAQFMRRHGYRTSLAGDANQARATLANGAFDLVVLDVMMPGEDGLSLLRTLRAGGTLPVILLTAMADDADRIVGLELGADDYVVKPFNPRELLARVRAVLRRAVEAPPSAPLRRRFGPWTHDPDRRLLMHEEGRTVDLTAAEARLLGALLDRPRAVLSRDQLLDLTQGREAKPYDRAIDNQVSRLRRKIEIDPRRPLLLVTEWGGGYRLAADVEEMSGDVNGPGS